MIIDVKHVSWKREKKMILQNISWQVNPGEHWCLVGLNGSGKTTLLNLLNGYIWPTTGTVTVLGHQFGECDLRELRKKIGWVSSSLQQKLYGHETAGRIVLSGKFASIGLYEQPEKQDEEEAISLMAFLGLEELSERTYDTLSHGERQKVLIARALMASPRLLILDEPCTGLDILAREQLLKLIDKIARQPGCPTLIYVTHHVEEILPCLSHTLLLKRGKVYTTGLTSKIMTSQLLSDFFDTSMEVLHQNGRFWISLTEPSTIS
ncbi:ABC transporter ATP-binding protein [Paenactinomyces guangxiensis]|uniref:ABC transporter ATP-binding protein n=1 Tax=Paenactinomyces guangxiensis TaxID=1490290 RepID=A0A7W1WTF3_9BACL|nr:ABC transporter ATP-binding protein [Paenactinomyces guangxiensis]MBA4495673.1 ABC transporter ATP-binding protein [Paenactinomyces guangxiensis]MBH8592661.1 ABC transporter ATP-binding protein [Paenactinomyces guangxiensis]